MTTEKRYERFYNALSFIAVYFVVASFITPFFGIVGSPLMTFAGFGIVLLLMLAGYWFQAFICFISRFDRRSDDGSYETNVKYFNVGRATIPILTAIITGICLIKPIENYLYKISVRNNEIYDENSLYPYIIVIMFMVLFIAGAVIWFFPYRRFTLLRFSMVCLPILCVSFFFGIQCGTIGVINAAICLLGFILIALILMNQGAINRQYGSFDSISFMTGKSRAYNILMTSSLLLLLILALGLAFVILSGIMVLVKFILLLIFMIEGPKRDDIEYVPPDVGGFVFGKSVSERASGSAVFSMFLLLVAIVILFFAMRRSKGFLKLLAAIKNWLMSFFDFLFSFSARKARKPVAEEGFRSYRDEEKRKQRAHIGKYSKKAEATRNYRDFLSKLNSYRSNEEKLEFAYTTLVMLLLRGQKFIKRSDTPRQIAAKLKSDPYYNGIDSITEAFEIVTYAEQELPEASYSGSLKTICTLVHRHLD